MQEALLPGAKVMLALGAILLYGGLAVFITIAVRSVRKRDGA